MIIKQSLKMLDKKKKTFVLSNTFDCGVAIEAAKEASDNGGRTNNSMIPMGFIPPEMWMYNPWLMTAKKAMLEGDKLTYHKNICKFFKLFPQFAVIHKKRFF